MSRRVQRVEELIKELLSKYIQIEMTDKIGIVFINAIVATSDFKEAKIYISALEQDKIDEAISFLNKKKGELHKFLKSELTMKFVPNLSFYPDNSLDKVTKLDQILGEIDMGKDHGA